jgi:hypothetical protein
MLACEARLKLLDLFLDFLFAVTRGKEDVVGVGETLLLFAVAIVPEGRVALFIALHDGGEFVVGLRAGQLQHDFIVAEIFIAKDAKFFQTFQPGQSDIKASIEKVKGLVEMDFGGERAARVFTHSALPEFTAKDAENEEEVRCDWFWVLLNADC